MEASNLTDEFAGLESAPDYSSRLALAEALPAKYPLSLLAGAPQFRRTLMLLGQQGNVATPEERIRALALFTIALSGGKELKKLAENLLKPLIIEAPGALGTIADEKVRFGVCTLIGRRRAGWIADYLAAEAAVFLSPDKVRSAAVAGTFFNASSWMDALDRIASAFSRAAIGASGTQVFYVAGNILSSVRLTLPKKTLEPGEAFGKALSTIVDVISHASHESLDEGVKTKVVIEVVHLVDAATALRPVLLEDRDLASVLTRARALMKAGKWPATATSTVSALMIRLCDAIRLLAAKGAAGRDLFSALEAIGGSRDAALRFTSPIAEQIEGLPHWLFTWLKEGYIPAGRNTGMNDSDDLQLATALIRASEFLLAARPDGKRQELDSGRLRDLGVSTAIEVEAVARRRALEIYGAVGDIVDFSPLTCNVVGKLPSDVTQVRILVPGVRRRLAQGGSEVVMLAVVEPVH